MDVVFPDDILVLISEFLPELSIHRTYPLINTQWLEIYPKCVRTLRLELKIKWERRLENNRSISLSSNMKGRLLTYLEKCNRLFSIDLSYIHVRNNLLIQVLNKFCHSIEYLSIPGNNLVTVNFINRLKLKCKNLKMLDVSYCHKLEKTFVKCLQKLPSTLDLIICNGLSSVTWEVLYKYAKSHDKTFLCAMHLMKSKEFDLRKYSKLHEEISESFAQEYYNFALVYGYENCCSLIYDYYRGQFPSISAIIKSFKRGTRGALKFLVLKKFPFSEIPVEIVVETMDNHHVHVCEYLRFAKCMDYFIDKFPMEKVDEWIRRGRFNCLTELRLSKFKKWNLVKLESVHEAVRFGRTQVLRTLQELQYSKMKDVDPEVVKKGILNGHTKFINFLPIEVLKKVKTKELGELGFRDIIRKIKHLIHSRKM